MISPFPMNIWRKWKPGIWTCMDSSPSHSPSTAGLGYSALSHISLALWITTLSPASQRTGFLILLEALMAGEGRERGLKGTPPRIRQIPSLVAWQERWLRCHWSSVGISILWENLGIQKKKRKSFHLGARHWLCLCCLQKVRAHFQVIAPKWNGAARCPTFGTATLTTGTENFPFPFAELRWSIISGWSEPYVYSSSIFRVCLKNMSLGSPRVGHGRQSMPRRFLHCSFCLLSWQLRSFMSRPPCSVGPNDFTPMSRSVGNDSVLLISEWEDISW